EVLASGQRLVDRGVLAREADAQADGLRVGADVDAEHRRSPAVGGEDRGEDAHRGGLAGTVRAEQAEHGPWRDLEGHTGERDDLAETLLDVVDDDGRFGHGAILAQIT